MRPSSGSKALVTDPGGGIIESLRPMMFKWRDEFLYKRSLSLEGENRAYFQVERNPSEDEDIMSVLSRLYEMESDRWAYKMESLQRLCAGVKLDVLTSSSLDKGVPAALVFDRDGSGRRLPSNDVPLTLSGLYRKLSKPRFGVPGAPLAIEEDKSDGSDARPAPWSQADQRIIYLADPNARSLSVLAATVSMKQALPLIDFMANRLFNKPRFSIHVPLKGIATFNMLFQLPFLAFRTVTSTDNEQEALEGRFNYTGLSFLTFDPDSDCRSATTDSHVLYEATFSCFIHGWDFARWTAYGLFDTYFDRPDCRESATHHFEDLKNSEPEFAGDPLTLAREDLNNPIVCPRHYFLRVLYHRMVRVRDEWWKVNAEVLERMQVGQARCQIAFEPFRPDTINTEVLLEAIDERQNMLNQVHQWNIKTRGLLIRFMRLLEKTVESWRTFASRDAKYLYQPGALVNVEPEAVRTLRSIDELVDEMASYYDELRHQVEVFEKGCMQEYEQHSRDFHTFLAGQAERTAQAQQRTAQAQQTMSEDVRVLTWVNFMFLPILVAASICSTQTTPFVLSLVLLVTVVLAILALGILKNWRWCSRILRWISDKIDTQRNVATIAHRDQPILPFSRSTITSTTERTVDQTSAVGIAPPLNGNDNLATHGSCGPDEVALELSKR